MLSVVVELLWVLFLHLLVHLARHLHRVRLQEALLPVLHRC
jgi:hypothetical protein